MCRARQLRAGIAALGLEVAAQARERGAHGVEARLAGRDRGGLDLPGAEPVDPLHRRLGVTGLPGVDGAPRRAQVCAQPPGVLAARQRVEPGEGAARIGDARVVGVEEAVVATEDEAPHGGLLVDHRVGEHERRSGRDVDLVHQAVAGVGQVLGGEHGGADGHQGRHRQQAGAEREPRSRAQPIGAHQAEPRPPASRIAAMSSSGAPPLRTRTSSMSRATSEAGSWGPAAARSTRRAAR